MKRTPRALGPARLLSVACGLLARAALGAAAAGLVVMMAIIAWQVFARFVLNDSPAWSEPLALLLMLYFILLAAAVGIREGSHLGVTWLVDKLRGAARTAALIAGDLIVGAFGLAMIASGVELARTMAPHAIPALGISRAFAYLPLVITGALIALFSAERLLLDAAGRAE